MGCGISKIENMGYQDFDEKFKKFLKEGNLDELNSLIKNKNEFIKYRETIFNIFVDYVNELQVHTNYTKPPEIVALFISILSYEDILVFVKIYNFKNEKFAKIILYQICNNFEFKSENININNIPLKIFVAYHVYVYKFTDKFKLQLENQRDKKMKERLAC
jgi:hypothetical protein